MNLKNNFNMKNLSRREFLGKTAAVAGTALIASRLPVSASAGTATLPVNMPIGFQVWPVRESLVKDFPGTLKQVAALGYQTVEMCSPPGYGFVPLMKLSAREMKQIINDAGLVCVSSHYGMDEFRKALDERIRFALDSGQTQMILSSFGLPKNATLDDWMKAADELNKMGEKAKSAGIQMGFHNHNMEFQKIDDKLIYDELMGRFDPNYIKMQFQVAVISIGYKAADYFKKYPGRFISAHLADWSAEKKTEVPIGQGVVDWKELFASLNTGGVKNVFVEMNPETFKASADYLHKL